MPATPRDAASDVLDRAENLLALDSSPTPEIAREDLRRMALALGVAALDTYLHWAIRNVDIRSMPKKLADLNVSFGQLVAMGQKSVEARNDGVNDRPGVRARNVLNERLLAITFQSARQVGDALAMLGVTKCWSKLAAAITPASTPAEIQEQLNHLAHRRNKIVHEGDLSRLVRPQRITRESIRRVDVDEDLAWIRSFIEALAHVAP